MPAFLAGDYRRRRLLTAAITLLVTFKSVISFQYKVGDLDSWGVPPPSLPNLYASWVLNHHFHINDSLCKSTIPLHQLLITQIYVVTILCFIADFLYPPSQDSVVQVTEKAFNVCIVTDPILKMEDGNSIFKFTSPGTFYFTSGVADHCEKRQKLQIAVPDANGAFFQPAGAPAAAAAGGPAAYPLVFGPMPEGGSSASPRLRGAVGGGLAVAIATLCWLF
ncbi:Early nodulin-like protein 1 [Dendrobium catenatum]|uniref:Early nodulin-like protein 1 n=1 Tax=Dendrobium catenatum TaxID=906689 RepID=A0A2I0VX69_9ASPA|nr:Early nodulin-like protein 1 [Dendrobium catenatum]